MIYETAKSYVDTPFLHQGRVPGSGIDCVGTVICSIKDNGGLIEDFTAYGRDSDPNALITRLEKDFIQVPFGAQQKDDVFVFWIVKRTAPQHVAIYDGEGNIVHSFAGRCEGRVMIEPLGNWIHKVHSVWRYQWQR